MATKRGYRVHHLPLFFSVIFFSLLLLIEVGVHAARQPGEAAPGFLKNVAVQDGNELGEKSRDYLHCVAILKSHSL